MANAIFNCQIGRLIWEMHEIIEQFNVNIFSNGVVQSLKLLEHARRYVSLAFRSAIQCFNALIELVFTN